MKQMWSKEEINAFPKNFASLVDSAGNPRFIEGDGAGLEKEGVTISYCKWSLSGTHLMFVISGSVADTKSIANTDILAEYNLPAFIFDKIIAVWAGNLEQKSVQLYASDWSTQNITARLKKSTNTMQITNGTNLTLTADRNFRIQFDLLIDAE